MNPAETYAALKLLEHALKSTIAEAAGRAEEYARTVRAKSLETDYGQVTVTRRKPTVAIDETALLAWAATNRPDVIAYRIAPADMAEALDVISIYRGDLLTPALDPLFVSAMRSRLVADGDDAIDPETGEAMAWASVKPGAEFLTTRLSAESKAEAEQYVADHVSALVEASLPRTVSS